MNKIKAQTKPIKYNLQTLGESKGPHSRKYLQALLQSNKSKREN